MELLLNPEPYGKGNRRFAGWILHLYPKCPLHQDGLPLQGMELFYLNPKPYNTAYNSLKPYSEP